MRARDTDRHRTHEGTIRRFVRRRLSSVRPHVERLRRVHRVTAGRKGAVRACLRSLRGGTLRMRRRERALLGQSTRAVSRVSRLGRRCRRLRMLVHRHGMLVDRCRSSTTHLSLRLRTVGRTHARTCPTAYRFYRDPVRVSIPARRSVLVISARVRRVREVRTSIRASLTVLISGTSRIRRRLRLRGRRRQRGVRSLGSSVRPATRRVRRSVRRVTRTRRLRTRCTRLVTLRTHFGGTLSSTNRTARGSRGCGPHRYFRDSF